MGAQVVLSGPKVYSCSNCRTHLSTDDDVISRVGTTAEALRRWTHRDRVTAVLRHVHLPLSCGTAGRSGVE